MKDLLESYKLPSNHQKEECDRTCRECKDNVAFSAAVQHQDPIPSMEMVPGSNFTEEDSPQNLEKRGQVCISASDGGAQSSAFLRVQSNQDAVSQSVDANSNLALENQENPLHSDSQKLALMNDHFRAQILRSGMDHLTNELERMKIYNSLLEDGNHADPKFPLLEREVMQLQKVNEELKDMYPMFNEFSSSGNALERVLALEVELAEALQAKKKASMHFQSSFLKQHSDEEAIFRSFRDINELIGDMLELKGRYQDMETELKDMHERYSELSVQFAEVEGERQKLLMTLRNVRASKRFSSLSRTSSATIEDNSS